jgi:hypothetical protein
VPVAGLVPAEPAVEAFPAVGAEVAEVLLLVELGDAVVDAVLGVSGCVTMYRKYPQLETQ